MPQPILEARSLVKRYGALTAVDDVSFSMEEGEFWTACPNGAGKAPSFHCSPGCSRQTVGRSVFWVSTQLQK